MCRSPLKALLVSAALLFLLQAATAYKFLGVFHTGARSHDIVGKALMLGLARKGHDVTVISPFALKEAMPNYKHVKLTSVSAYMEANKANLFELMNINIVASTLMLQGMGVMLTEAALREETVQELLKSNQTFDAVICEVFVSDALYGLSEHFNAPLIGVSTFGAHTWNTDLVGSPSPPSYVPSAMLHYTDRMSLLDRIGNLAFVTFERLLLEYSYMPKQEALYKEHFPHAKRTLQELRKNVALVLLNQHVSLSFPRPYMPNHIEVGGMHVNRKRNPLPTDIQQFLDGAKHGAIYFSMGSNLQSKHMPAEKRAAILKTFGQLKQRVLWKFEDVDLPDKPDNVYISKWFPQDDILAHENVRAFITHGGLLSITESIYHGKPFIGLPIFGDQFLNMARADSNGYGIQLSYKQLTAESFKNAIDRILSDPTYTQKVRAMSAQYRDQPQEPLERAVYWVEHVVRHKGARYLHSAGQDLSFIQYHNIDAMIILYGGLLVILVLIAVLVVCVLRAIWRKLTGSAKRTKQD